MFLNIIYYYNYNIQNLTYYNIVLNILNIGFLYILLNKIIYSKIPTNEDKFVYSIKKELDLSKKYRTGQMTDNPETKKEVNDFFENK